jgi:phage-related protein
MTVQAPLTHVEEAMKLSADGYVDLWEMQLHGSATVVRFWNGATKTWQGQSYEQLACQMVGDSLSADGKLSRPTLNVVNPAKILGSFAAQGLFDLAVVTRKRLLQADFQNNVNAFQPNIWIVGRVVAVTAQVLTLELRQTTDMPIWLTPRRTYQPPDFPFVTL